VLRSVRENMEGGETVVYFKILHQHRANIFERITKILPHNLIPVLWSNFLLLL
jgi:hypothetical protein